MNDDVTAAMKRLEARLAQAWPTGDPSPLLVPEADGEIALLSRVVDGHRQQDDMSMLLGWTFWYRSTVLPAARAETEYTNAVRLFVPAFMVRDHQEFPAPLLPRLALGAAAFGSAALQAAIKARNEQMLEVAIAGMRRAVEHLPATAAQRGACLSNLGTALRTRYDWHRRLPDLDEAIQVRRAVLQTPEPDSRRRLQQLTELGATLDIRFGIVKDTADIDEAVDVLRQGLDLTAPADPERHRRLSYLAAVVDARFRALGRFTDAEETLRLRRAALEALPPGHAERGKRLAQLCGALRQFGEAVTTPSAALDEGIALASKTISEPAITRADRASASTSLGAALLARHTLTDARADLDDAVHTLESAVAQATDDQPDRTAAWATLGVALRIRFDADESPADLTEAIRLQRAAVDAAPVENPDRLRQLGQLATTLLTGGETTSDAAMLDEAVAIRQHLLGTSPSGHPDRPSRLDAVAAALRARFLRRGAEPDLDVAIELQREAVQSSGNTVYLGSLAELLRTRFERSGALADADEAIQVLHRALAITPEGRQRPLLLASLGAGQLARLRRNWSASLADDTVRLLREALAATPPRDPHHAQILSHLGAALWQRHEHSGDAADLDEAIDTQRQAAAATPPGHPDRAFYLENLAFALSRRYETRHNPADIAEAIETHRAAIALTPPGHPERGRRLAGLGHAHEARFTHVGTTADRDDAIAAFTESANAAETNPSYRIIAARRAGRLLTGVDAAATADCFQLAVGLLSGVAPRALHRGDQQAELQLTAGMASAAAAAVLSDPRLSARQRAEQAVLYLESCRGVLLNRSLDTRTDLSDLRGTRRELADEYERLRALLEEPAASVDSRRRAAADLAALTEQIRATTPFTTFGLPPAIDHLLAEAALGPIVFISESDHRADALVLTSAGVTVVELDFTQDEFLDQIGAFYRALRTRRGLDTVLAWLWDRVAGPVLESLGFRRMPDGQWPRLWWVPVGLFGLLPLHAAGHHDDPPDDAQRRVVHDRVVSSYTPTVRALRYARAARPAPQQPPHALVVGVPTVPGVPGRLDCVPEEAAAVRRYFPDGEDFIEPTRTPTTAAVLDQLPHHAVAHFACHGVTDAEDPSRSQLLLPDYATAPLTVARLTDRHSHLGAARLAYLSACGTTAIDRLDLLDEAIHLTGAYQLAGYPQVIGTLWEINDLIAADVAAAFYARMQAPDGRIDTSRGALALHDTIRTLAREYAQAPWLWAAYLHTGC
jgi:CHAT domain-containing protein/tetratricopeptide repeat protein